MHHNGVHHDLVVLVARIVHDEKPVDEAPDTAATTGEELADSQTGIPDVEAINTQATCENRENEGCRWIFELRSVHQDGVVKLRYAVTQVGELCGGEKLRVGGEEHIDFVLIHRLSDLFV